MGSLFTLFLGITITNVILLLLDIGLIYLVIINSSLFLATMIKITFYMQSFHHKYVNEGKNMSDRIIESRKNNQNDFKK
mgnify:CR=1 FL=1